MADDSMDSTGLITYLGATCNTCQVEATADFIFHLPLLQQYYSIGSEPKSQSSRGRCKFPPAHLGRVSKESLGHKRSILGG